MVSWKSVVDNPTPRIALLTKLWLHPVRTSERTAMKKGSPTGTRLKFGGNFVFWVIFLDNGEPNTYLRKAGGAVGRKGATMCRRVPVRQINLAGSASAPYASGIKQRRRSKDLDRTRTP